MTHNVTTGRDTMSKPAVTQCHNRPWHTMSQPAIPHNVTTGRDNVTTGHDTQCHNRPWHTMSQLAVTQCHNRPWHTLSQPTVTHNVTTGRDTMSQPAVTHCHNRPLYTMSQETRSEVHSLGLPDVRIFLEEMRKMGECARSYMFKNCRNQFLCFHFLCILGTMVLLLSLLEHFLP